MSASSKTGFDVRCDIISDLWVVDDDNLQELYKEYEVGFALAFSVKNGYAEVTDEGLEVIDELWNTVLEIIGVEDTGFTSTEDLDEAITNADPEYARLKNKAEVEGFVSYLDDMAKEIESNK